MMLGHNRQAVLAALFDEFEVKNRHTGKTDELKGALIIVYERALEGGLSPSSALAAMLEWVSSELKRRMQIQFLE